MAILKSDKEDFRAKKITRNIEGHNDKRVNPPKRHSKHTYFACKS